MSNSPEAMTLDMSSASRGGWTQHDTQWVLSLFGTAVGAGILFLPINIGIGGFWPLLIMALLAFPMTFLAHRGLARFVLSSKQDNADYIKDYQTVENIIREQESTIEKQMVLEDIYEEIQAPVIAMIIYFLFQLPAFKKYERKLIPGLFGEDFNINTYGILFNSILIGLIIFILRRVVKYA